MACFVAVSGYGGKKNEHSTLHSRVWARRLAMQAVYQQLVTSLGTDEVISQFEQDDSFSKADANYFVQLLRGGAMHKQEIAEKIQSISGYDFDLVDPVERAILLNGTYEILFLPDIDKAVAITEAVHLAKKFGAPESYRFINGVLDKVDQ